MTTIQKHLVTPKQLRTLLALYSLSPRAAITEGNPRDARLSWASQTIARQLHSFSDLSVDEAAILIDSLKKEVGQPISPRPERKPRERNLRKGNAIALATADDFRLIFSLRDQLGWSVSDLDSWLHGPYSPTRGKKLLTEAACRAVITALRVMVRREVTSRPAA